MKDFSPSSVSGYAQSYPAGKKTVLNNVRQKWFMIGTGLVILIVAGLFITRQMRASANASGTPTLTAGVSDTKQQTNTVIAKKDINQEFLISIPGVKNNENLKYSIESAELTDEIVINGQKAKAANGRLFIILNLKLTNETNQGLKINTRDFVRLSITGQDAVKLAPDIHNDPVEVQAISTKYTRVGFPVNAADRNYVLQIGEINKEKTTIDLTFE